MSKNVKITKADIEKARNDMIKNISALNEIEKKIKKLPFGNEHLSKGNCAESMESLNKEFSKISTELSTLIEATIGFLDEAEKAWFEVDSKIAKKY